MQSKRGRAHRRRRGANMIPFTMCSQGIGILNNGSCHTPTIVATLIEPLSGDEKPPGVVIEEWEQTYSKSLTVLSMRFHWAVYVSLAQSVTGAGLFAYSVRVGIVKMAMDPITGTPQQLPNLFVGSDRDLGDVLWRGAAMVKQPLLDDSETGVSGQANMAICGSMSREGSHSLMEHVKAKRRLDKSQGLFWVVNIHNPTNIDNVSDLGYDLFGVAAVRRNQR